MRELRLSAFACLVWVSGCGNTEANLERLLAEMLPDGVTAAVTESCTPFMGPAVGLFTISTAEPGATLEDSLAAHSPGRWTRAPSLSA